MSGNFLTPPILLWWPIWEIVGKPFLIAQKKRCDVLNAVQKTPAINKVRLQKKNKKNLQKLPFLAILVKNGIFWRFFLFL